MKIDRATLSTIIEKMAAEYMVEHSIESVRAINAGDCGDFASDVMQHVDDDDLQILGIDNFMVVDGDDLDFDFCGGRPLDRSLLTEYWPGVEPTQGLDCDGIDALSASAGWSGGTHEWLTFDGLHYDAEAPQGVVNLFDLPFFQRVIAGWNEVYSPAPVI